MKEQLISMIVSMAVKKMTEEDLKRWADMGLDIIEDTVVGTDNPYDDMVVLPMCSAIRKSFDIPDND